MHIQDLMLIPIVLIIYGWVKSLPPPRSKSQHKKKRKKSRRKYRKGHAPVFCPVDDDIQFCEDDFYCISESNFDYSQPDDNLIFSDDDDYLTDINYSYLSYNIYHID